MSANDLTNTFNIFLIISAIALPMPFGSVYTYRFIKKHFKFKSNIESLENAQILRGTMPKDFKPIKKVAKIKIHHNILLSLGLAKRKNIG